MEGVPLQPHAACSPCSGLFLFMRRPAPVGAACYGIASWGDFHFRSVKQIFLLLGVTAATAGHALVGSAPAQALVMCTGNTTLGTLEGGFGSDCGPLSIGETVRIDVSSYFQPGGFAFENPDQPIAPGVGTNGTSSVAFRDVEVSFTALDVEGSTLFSGPAAVWGDVPNGTFGSADTVTYNATNPSSLPTDTFRTLAFRFNEPGIGVFVGEALSVNQIGMALGIDMARVTNATFSATLVEGVNPINPTIVGFGLESRIPGVIPQDGTVIGGNVTTVPGPLPIAGAGAAFAWSRKLRRKQKLAASSRSTN